ncbi:MAG: alpha/beta hydrolase [Gammaproteobacteria bacterium]|nr:alpha/beta hydrolase [Gammaproteobacteria bacterium]MBT8111907.1 alpha/beta hydrolase [Gammaproteobacteria bacterium]NND47926.1 alpha/beta hydrolase [Woeseiaceae bacterium]NNL46606.1 alpha/beta hydrolase [Woeseiaceae bacterium]
MDMLKVRIFIRPLIPIGMVLLASCGPEPEPRQMIGSLSVDDYQLSYVCAGKGSPTIFLEAPSGISGEQAFSSVFEEIAAANKVCRLERLGFGDSDPVPPSLNQTVKDYSHELRELVKAVSPDDDVVIVGYSFGGLIARYYAAHYPSNVKGLLLIDAAHEDWIREMKAQMSEDDWQKMQEILYWFRANLGHNVWDSQKEMDDSPLIDQSMPIRVISRGLDFQRIRLAEVSEDGFRIYNDLHNKYQVAQENLSKNTTRVIAARSEHFIPDTEPELVLAELRRLLSEIETHP